MIFDELMESRKASVKAKTISDYQHKAKFYFRDLENVRIDRLNNKRIQNTVNFIKQSD